MDVFLSVVAVAMMEVMLERTSTGVPSIAMMILLRSWERQQGMGTAGVEGEQERRRRCCVS